MANGRYTAGGTVRTVAKAVFVLLAVAAAVCFFAIRLHGRGRAKEIAASADGNTAVYFMDVGQGDACLIRSAHGRYMLIDAGPTEHDASTVQFLRSHGVQKLDVLLLSHPHEDHFGGITRVMDTFEIGIFAAHRDFSVTYPVDRFRQMLTQRDPDSVFRGVGAGDSFYFDGDILVSILSPAKADEDDANESSLLVRVTYGDTSFLFTGDCGRTTEERLLADGVSLAADVIKIGHHGSSASSTPAFIEAVDPSAAVISVGKDNGYGHPSSVTLRTLSERGIDIYRTDQRGSMLFLSDGAKIYLCTSDEASVERVYTPRHKA